LDRTCEKLRSTGRSQGGNNFPIHNKTKEGELDWLRLVQGCLLKHVSGGKVEGKLEMRERRGRRSKQLLNYLKKSRRSWELKEITLDSTLWRIRFGRDYGLVGRQTAERTN